MTERQPNPGHGYIVCERLGEGTSKEVYRAVKQGEWRDRALARFKECPSLDELLGEIQLLDELSQRGAGHVARVYVPFKGDDGQIYLPEELLFKPLGALCPLRNAERFFRFGTDLSDGLASLHELRPPKVHRDLKLENCGVDYFGRAKIFDLGAVTSEGSIADQTIL